MKAKPFVFAALAVLALLLVAYVATRRPEWANAGYWQAHFLEDADQIYARSAGGWDTAAALALRRSQGGTAAATVADHLRAATIIHRNIIRQEHRPRVGPDGEPTDAAREVSRLRQEMFHQARDHYAAALEGLTDGRLQAAAAAQVAAPLEAAAAGGARDGGVEGGAGGAPPRARDPGAEMVIDAAIEFAFGGLEALLQNDPILAVLFAEQMREGGGDLLIIPDAGLLQAAENRRAATIQTRRAAAAEAAAGQGKARRAEAFLGLSVQHTSDSQNSHDVSVNAAKRGLVARLRREQAPLERLPSLDQIAAALRSDTDRLSRDPASGKPRPARTEQALAVVARAKAGERSLAADAGDEEVLRRVWARAAHPSNAAQAGPLRQAVYDALVDCWERGIQGEKIQCVDGRIGRLLSALTLLDFDEATWGLKRLEQHKNEVYAEAQKVIREAAQEAAQGADPEMRRVGRGFLAATPAELAAAGTPSPAAEAAFLAATHARIEAMIDAHVAASEHTAGGALPPHAVEGLKKEATASLY
jgi:hypothetical protein